MIHLEHVTYTYPGSKTPALRDLDLDIGAGSLVGVVGPNGAGKSTLCAALAGFIPHHYHGALRGRITVAGMDTASAALAQLVTRVGLVSQNPYNQTSYSRLTVEEEVAFGLENLGVPRVEMHRRVGQTLELLGLTALAGRSPFALSGGELQRVVLASILVLEPPVLVLDEPTAQLDPAGAHEVFKALRAITRGGGRTVVLAEQRTEWLAAYADRVLALESGALIADGPPPQVLASERVAASGVLLPRCASAARAARNRGLWPVDHPLPVTTEQAVEGFQPEAQKRG